MLKYLLASAVSVAGALTFPASIQAEPINFRATLLVSCSPVPRRRRRILVCFERPRREADPAPFKGGVVSSK